MATQRLYYEPDARERSVQTAWPLKTVALWALILGPAVMVACTVLALDASTTPEQRLASFVASGAFP